MAKIKLKVKFMVGLWIVLIFTLSSCRSTFSSFVLGILNSPAARGPAVVPSSGVSPLPSAGPTAPSTSPGTSSSGFCIHDRGMWLWTTQELFGNAAEQDRLILASSQANITDIFIYLIADNYLTQQSSIQALVKKLSAAGIRSWGLEGWRGYFADATGPLRYNAAIDALIAYNSRVSPPEQFVGFHADLEPNDGQGTEFRTTFHNDIADSQLNAIGGGVWYSTQVLDRDYLMQNWIQLFTVSSQKLHAAQLKFGAAMPSWIPNMYGEPIHVTFNGVRQNLLSVILPLTDSYVIMSYNTSPTNVEGRIIDALAFSDTLPAASRPRVYGSLETHPGSGVNVSYADTPGKQTRTIVMNDIATIQKVLDSHPSFCGMSIHDWVGWNQLTP